MKLFSRLLREPLLHFLISGAMVFVLFQAMPNPEQDRPNRITVSEAQIKRLAALWERTRQRPPTSVELRGLVEDYIEEEIYYREALVLRLDRNDTIIRRRLRQKMEFLSADLVNATEPSDAELEAFLERNIDNYRVEPRVAFRQIYLSIDKRVAAISQDAEDILNFVRSQGTDADISTMGDPTQLPAEIPLSSKTQIARIFGQTFAEAAVNLDAGRWMGPLRSTYGAHVVLILQREDGREPALAEVRKAVVRDWLAERRMKLQRQRFERLRQTYKIKIEWPETVQDASGIK